MGHVPSESALNRFLSYEQQARKQLLAYHLGQTFGLTCST